MVQHPKTQGALPSGPRGVLGSQCCPGDPAVPRGPCGALGLLCQDTDGEQHQELEECLGYPEGKGKGTKISGTFQRAPGKTTRVSFVPAASPGPCCCREKRGDAAWPAPCTHRSPRDVLGCQNLLGSRSWLPTRTHSSLGSFLGPGWQEEAGGSDTGSRAGIQPGAQRRRCRAQAAQACLRVTLLPVPTHPPGSVPAISGGRATRNPASSPFIRAAF